MTTGEGKHVDRISHNQNEIQDISISSLKEHLGKTLGPIEIEENYSKCINLTQASVLS